MGEFGRVGIVRFCMWAHVLVCMSCLDVWILAPWLWILIPFWCMCLTRGLGLLHLVAFCELFLWILMAWFMWLHFDLGQLLIAPHLVTLTCLLSVFVRAHMTPERISCLAFHFICGIPFGDLFRLPVLTCFLWWCRLERSLGFLFL